jgi:hypothetical protein
MATLYVDLEYLRIGVANQENGEKKYLVLHVNFFVRREYGRRWNSVNLIKVNTFSFMLFWIVMLKVKTKLVLIITLKYSWSIFIS